MHDILRDTPIYQLILQEGRQEGLVEGIEKGLEQGIEKGLEQARQLLRQTISTIVAERFPKLSKLARKQVVFVENTDVLQDLIVKLSVSQNEAEARQHLLAVDDEEEAV